MKSSSQVREEALPGTIQITESPANRGKHTLRNWIRQDEADRSQRADRPTTDMIEENRRLRRENAELRRVNDVLRAASAYFASEIDPARRRS
jgi:transposase